MSQTRNFSLVQSILIHLGIKRLIPIKHLHSNNVKILLLIDLNKSLVYNQDNDWVKQEILSPDPLLDYD